MLYIEIARHDNTPVPTLEGLFKHWWGNVAWHSSSVIALDNVDNLLGVELEVRLFILPLIQIPFKYDTSRSSS
ncbi:hypothetical protein FIBSPDRAFT_847131 [Athelia psychrophila]|uniref:Uncharacterized protein n=1 Tax=Athelia psychrophila TaxID=1759441 RepID=A0A166WQK3_9AGAM|nr:hypothetical protein FIBSPDRAFT_847131 [Fibularhizoctonia sp. CBS 109695]